MEIERKFLLKELPNLAEFEFHKIEQAYLCTGPVVRVRREDEKYYMTYKGGGMMSRVEYNLPLSALGHFRRRTVRTDRHRLHPGLRHPAPDQLRPW